MYLHENGDVDLRMVSKSALARYRFYDLQMYHF